MTNLIKNIDMVIFSCYNNKTIKAFPNRYKYTIKEKDAFIASIFLKLKNDNGYYYILQFPHTFCENFVNSYKKLLTNQK